MLEKTWIGVTGQRWKVYISLVLMSATIASIAGAWVYADQEDLFILGILAFVGIGLTWLLWTFFSFRCPSCRSHVVWRVLRLLPHEESIQVAFFFLTNCPACKRAFFEAIPRPPAR
jgi:hypothetical protein